MKGKKEEVVICDPPQSLIELIGWTAILAAIAVAGILFLDGIAKGSLIRAALLATGGGIVTFFGTIVVGAILVGITAFPYRGWDKHFPSQVAYEAWKAQEAEAERQREEERERERRKALAQEKEAERQREQERERKRKEDLARQEELRKAREQARANSITALQNFLSSLEKDPQIVKLLARLHTGPVDRGTINQALANPDIVLAGIGSWLKRKGRYNNLPDVGWPASSGKGRVEGPLDDLFDQLSSKESNAFLDMLSQGAELAEEALAQGVSQREILELLLPLILS